MVGLQHKLVALVVGGITSLHRQLNIANCKKFAVVAVEAEVVIMGTCRGVFFVEPIVLGLRCVCRVVLPCKQGVHLRLLNSPSSPSSNLSSHYIHAVNSLYSIGLGSRCPGNC